MIPIAVDAITADHLRTLVQNGVREGRTIEYKRSLPGASDADKKEFLADLSSFANAAGGDLIYGIAAENGVPTEIKGLTSFDADKDVLRLDSVIRDGLQPRILGLRTKVVEGLDEGPVLVVRVPKGWSGPHMVGQKKVSGTESLIREFGENGQWYRDIHHGWTWHFHLAIRPGTSLK